MSKIRLTLTAQVTGDRVWPGISPNGHWIALNFNGNCRLFNALTGEEVASFPLDSYWVGVANSGKHIATMMEEELIVVGSDGASRKRHFPKPKKHLEAHGNFVFSSDGNMLWAALHDEHEHGQVALVDIATLQVVDSVPMPVDKDNYYSKELRSWWSTEMIADDLSGTMAITHSAGDSYLGTFFFQHAGTRIRQLPAFISQENGVDILRPLRNLCFSSTGNYFAALDWNILNVWRLSDLQVMGDGAVDIVDLEVEDIQGLSFLEDNPIIAISDYRRDDEIYELRLLEIDAKKCSCLATVQLPVPLQFMEMYGRTLVGYSSDGDLSVYRID